jgi:hypothetical protein
MTIQDRECQATDGSLYERFCTPERVEKKTPLADGQGPKRRR